MAVTSMVIMSFSQIFKEIDLDVENIKRSTLFFGSCSLWRQLVARHYIRNFKGFVTHFTNGSDFRTVLNDAGRKSIDGRMRMVVMSNVHTVPVEYIKQLCSLNHVLVVASGELKTPIHGFFYLVRLAPALEEQKKSVLNYASDIGMSIPDVESTGKAQSFAAFLAICDGQRLPAVRLKYPEATAYTLLTTGAAGSDICKIILAHALPGCRTEKAKHKVVKLVSDCDLQMTVCKRNLMLCKILQDYLTQIAKYSSSD
jgi:hypothetical protein